MDKLRIGFVGCGWMGQNAHIANYATLPDVELAALADLRPDTPREVARRYGIPKTYTTHQEMLAEEPLDAVVAVMYFGLHAAVVPDILSAGMHLLTEKPICQCADQAHRMDALARGKGVVYHIGYMKRADPATARAKALIDDWKASGAQGQLNYLRVTMPPGDWILGHEWPLDLGDRPPDGAGPAMEGVPAWMDEAQGRDYVSFINFYIHQVNLIRHLLGEDYELEYIDSRRRILAAKSASGVAIVLEMATFTTRDEWVEEYEAHFDRARVRLSLPAPMARQRSGRLEILRHDDSGAVRESPVIAPAWSMREQARIFVEEARGLRPNISPAADAAKDLEFAEAFIRLANTGATK